MKEKESNMNGRIYPEGFIKSEYQKYLENKAKEKTKLDKQLILYTILILTVFGMICYMSDMLEIFFMIIGFLGVNLLIAIFGPPTGDGW